MRGPGAVVLEISMDYHCSEFGGKIQAFLQGANGDPVFGGSTLFSGQHYAAIPILPDTYYRTVSTPPMDDVSRQGDDQTSTVSESTPEQDRILAYAIEANKRNPAVLATQRPISLSAYSLWLAQLDDQGVQLFKRGPFDIDDKPLPWDLIVVDHESPCFGLLPLDCVYRKLLETRDRICEKLSASSPECLLLSFWLDANPLGLNVVCSLGKGTIAKVSGEPPKVTISGEEFLRHKGPAEVIVHEVSHLIDRYGGRSENIRCYDRAHKMKLAAEARNRDLLGNPDNLPREPEDEWQAALDQTGADKQYAENLMGDCKLNSLTESIETECRALFYALDRSRTLVDENEPLEASQNCLFHATASMFNSLVIDFYNELNIHNKDAFRHIKPALKACFGQIISWLEQPENAAIKQRFQNSYTNQEHQWSFWDALDTYHALCCD